MYFYFSYCFQVAGLGNDRVRRADPKQVRLKEGVKKFLAKREEEDKIKKDEERRKKENLIQLRQQDRKATNRVRKMLSMTKSANKSCVEDAKDSLNASVAAQTQGTFAHILTVKLLIYSPKKMFYNFLVQTCMY